MDNPSKQGFFKVTVRGAGGNRTVNARWHKETPKKPADWFEICSPGGDATKEKEFKRISDKVIHWEALSRSEADAAMRRELTFDERVAKSYEEYIGKYSLWRQREVPVPADRVLRVGEPLEYGLIRGCYVRAVHDEGRVITFSVNGTSAEDPSAELRTEHWLQLLSKQKQSPTKLFNSPRYARISPSNTMLGSLVDSVWVQGMSDSPDYQRSYVWTSDDEQRFLDSVFNGRNLGTFTFLRYRYPRPEEIFDGKQRLTTMLKLISSEIPYQGYYWHQMSAMDRDEVCNRNVGYVRLEGNQFSRAELLQMFLDLNAAGVPQTEEHLKKVRDMLKQELQQEQQDGD